VGAWCECRVFGVISTWVFLRMRPVGNAESVIESNAVGAWGAGNDVGRSKFGAA
jgi:hypothetical protein